MGVSDPQLTRKLTAMADRPPPPLDLPLSIKGFFVSHCAVTNIWTEKYQYPNHSAAQAMVTLCRRPVCKRQRFVNDRRLVADWLSEQFGRLKDFNAASCRPTCSNNHRCNWEE